MTSGERAGAGSKRDSAPAARAPVVAPSPAGERVALLAPDQAAARERLGNRAFSSLLLGASPPPPDGPFTNAASVRVTSFDDPLERAADGAIDVSVTPGLLSPVTPAVLSALRGIEGAGAPLDSSLRVDAEQSLGVRLPDVRLFRSPAPAALDTRAFAYGSDIFLAPTAPSPFTMAGRALLHHELAHVHQQARLGERFIQREPPKKRTDGDWEIDEYNEGYAVRINKKERKVEIHAGGKRWITLSAPKNGAMPSVGIGWGSSSEGAITVAQQVVVQLKTEADVEIDVDKDVEDEVFKRLVGDRAEILYKLTAGGTATFRSTFKKVFAPGGMLVWGPDGKTIWQEFEQIRQFALPMTMRVTEERHVWVNSDVQYANRRFEQITADKLPNSFPTFDTLEGLKKFLDAAPKHDFLVLKMPDGKYVARAVNEEQMQRLAQSIRENRTDFGYLPNLARYSGKAARGEFLTFWLHGKEFSSPDAIRDLYYPNEAFAEVGASDSVPECEVYRTGKDSFGRRPLTHTEAAMLLRSFDKMSKDEVYARQVEGFPFVSLRFQGVAKLHVVDERYFEGREIFKTNAPKIEAITRQTPMEERFKLYDAIRSLTSEHFISIELDREQDNPDVIALLKKSRAAQDVVARMVWRQITHHANFVARREIGKGVEELKPFKDDTLLRGVALTFALGTEKQKKDTLNFLGVDTSLHEAFTRVLSDRASAWRIAQGQTVTEPYRGRIEGRGVVPPGTKVSLETLGAAVTAQLENLGKTITALETKDSDGEFEFSAISAKGEFGDSVRALTYRDLGLRLNPKEWPHGNVSPGWFPSPLEGDRSKFGSTYEQIYANQSNSHDSWDVVKLVAKITAMAVAAAILILVAHVVGTFVVAALKLSGVAAFAVYTATSAIVLTGGEALQARLLEGRWPALHEVIKSFITNLVMVGGFTKFGKALEGMSSLARTSIMGATFLGLSLTERLLHGGFDSPRDFFLWFYENVVMFAVLEAGGKLIRPLDVRLQFWGRTRRLGILVTEIDALVGDIGKLQTTMADLMTTPHRARAEAPRLQAETRRLLELQKDLAVKVAEKVKDAKDPEAKHVAEELKQELKAVDEALGAMAEAEFLVALQISPAGGAPNIFEYKASASAVETLKKFYPKDTKIESSPDGVIRVTIPGQGTPFVLYPEGHAMLPVPKQGPIKTKLNLNDATVEDILNAEIPGVGKSTAEKIVEARKQRGGLFKSLDDLLGIKDIGPKTVDKIKTSGKVEVGPKEKTNVIETQKALRDRIADIVERARRLNIEDKSVAALKKKQIGTFEEDIAKDRAEIDKVERALNEKIKKAGAKARKRYENRKSTPKDWLKQVKVERLSSVSDEVINEALTQIPTGKRRVTNLSPKQIRAIVLAHMEGAPIKRFLETGKDFTVAQRNRALDLYLEAAEHRIVGAGRVLAEMAQQSSKFKGGLFVLEQAEFVGFSKIREFEMPRRLGETTRAVDIVLKGDGVWVECKDWHAWETNNPDKLAHQFRKDVILNQYDPAVFKRLRYVFRKPAPRSVGEIKEFLRKALQAELTAARDADAITAKQQEELMAAFDKETNLVTESALREEHGLLTPDPNSVKSSPLTPVPPPMPDDGNDEEEEEEE